MDKYLVKTPRESVDKDRIRKSKVKTLKQKTIKSLQGVVVIEDIERLKSRLEEPTQTKTMTLSCLEKLEAKIPPRNVLVSTKIGHTVNKLRKHPDEDISRKAKTIYVKWKNFYKDHLLRPTIDVKCDKKTADIRQKGKALLSEALRVQADHELVQAIEKEVYNRHKRLVSPSYRRTVRGMVLRLMHTAEVREMVLRGDLSVAGLVSQCTKS